MVLRRIKEELRDFEGKKLFKERNAKTVPFELSPTEKYLYDQVTEYINCYLGRTKGKKQGAVALARTVLQRRLASSLNAIYSSLKRREKRFTDLLEELRNLSTYEQHKRLLELGRINQGSMPNDDATNGFSNSRNSYTNNSADDSNDFSNSRNLYTNNSADDSKSFSNSRNSYSNNSPKNRSKNNYVVEDILEDDDFTEDELENFSVNATVAEQLDELETELKDLRRLVKLAEQTIEKGDETKLNALKYCLEGSEFNELTGGGGKLLIFTEHRDTLSYLKENLGKWGYSICEIHGGMNAIARKIAQKDFQFNKQICLATEAAGEGINLQFCHLMINYDIPWSPHRLEQRMGRIHCIGQPKDVYVFNFVAINTVEGSVLNKLLRKLEEIKAVMGDKVFDVIGQLLQLNNINFEDLIKEATYGKAEEEKAYETVEKLDPDKLKELEEATGIALATSHVDLSQVRKTKEQDFLSEERRLMPRYVEEFFARACDYLGIKLEVRADGLWRIPYLKEEFRSPLLDAGRKLGIAEKEYKKFTFYKEKLEELSYADGEFVSPAHPLFGAISERLDYKLAQTVGFQSALFSDTDAVKPYRIHFYQVEITGEERVNPLLLGQ
ncbi:helicase-related protein [Geminocystis sp.]|uniref:helicase-related protein n=1 Tax=Geminocystis sp. TaxID=2664100 RepID=UPI00359365A6